MEQVNPREAKALEHWFRRMLLEDARSPRWPCSRATIRSYACTIFCTINPSPREFALTSKVLRLYYEYQRDREESPAWTQVDAFEDLRA